MNAEDLAKRRAALIRLAIATRERLPDGKDERTAFFRVYFDDLEGFSTATFVEACRRLESSLEWFPKKAELVEACAAIVRHREALRKPSFALLPGDRAADPVKIAEFKERVNAAIGKKAMR